MPLPASDHAEKVSEELAERMTRLRHRIMGEQGSSRSDAGKPKPEAVNPQPEHPEKQEEQDAPSHLRSG